MILSRGGVSAKSAVSAMSANTYWQTWTISNVPVFSDSAKVAMSAVSAKCFLADTSELAI